jgi:hypothetical protein
MAPSSVPMLVTASLKTQRVSRLSGSYCKAVASNFPALGLMLALGM